MRWVIRSGKWMEQGIDWRCPNNLASIPGCLTVGFWLQTDSKTHTNECMRRFALSSYRQQTSTTTTKHIQILLTSLLLRDFQSFLTKQTARPISQIPHTKVTTMARVLKLGMLLLAGAALGQAQQQVLTADTTTVDPRIARRLARREERQAARKSTTTTPPANPLPPTTTGGVTTPRSVTTETSRRSTVPPATTTDRTTVSGSVTTQATTRATLPPGTTTQKPVVNRVASATTTPGSVQPIEPKEPETGGPLRAPEPKDPEPEPAPVEQKAPESGVQK